MKCKVTYENECGYWNWHCVTCDKKGPATTEQIIALSEGLDRRLEVAYVDVNPLEGLAP